MVWNGVGAKEYNFLPNPELRDRLGLWLKDRQTLAIEMIACYGMPVGAETFQTCLWIGRFLQIWEQAGGQTRLCYRRDIKLHLCGSARAKDGNIRQALLDRFGGRDMAQGKKKYPGPLYGISGHLWSALAVAVYAMETPE